MDYLASQSDSEEDGLFDDRLKAFCETLSKQVEAFAARENKPKEKVP